MIKQLTDLITINNKRPDWNEYFMMCAILLSSRSTCQRLHVGCVLVKENRIISSGYNGHFSGCKHESIIRNNHEQATIHAEQNAIADAAKRGVSINNTTAYITHFPCTNCTKLLVQTGISKIVYLNDYNNDELVERLLSQTNVIIKKLL